MYCAIGATSGGTAMGRCSWRQDRFHIADSSSNICWYLRTSSHAGKRWRYCELLMEKPWWQHLKTVVFRWNCLTTFWGKMVRTLRMIYGHGTWRAIGWFSTKCLHIILKLTLPKGQTRRQITATFIQEDHRDWDVYLHEFSPVVNTGCQASTKVSPAFLNFGSDPKAVVSLRRE